MLRKPITEGIVQFISKVYVKVVSFHKKLKESSQVLCLSDTAIKTRIKQLVNLACTQASIRDNSAMKFIWLLLSCSLHGSTRLSIAEHKIYRYSNQNITMSNGGISEVAIFTLVPCDGSRFKELRLLKNQFSICQNICFTPGVPCTPQEGFLVLC